MALNFPASPTDGQIHTDTATGVQYVYVGAYGYWSTVNIIDDAYDTANSANATAISAFDKANSANVLAYNTGIGANAYADSVGTSSNAYADSVGVAANSYSVTVGAESNNWANSVGTAGNTFAGSMANSSNAYADSVGAAANNWANTKLSLSGGTINGDLEITGNLNVLGNATTFTANNLVINDPFILLANNNTADIVDIGIVAHYTNATSVVDHTGFFRSANTKEWYLFKNYSEHFFYDGQGNIDLSGNNFTLDILNSDIRTSNLILGGQNAITWIIDVGAASNAWANSIGTTANIVANSVNTTAIAAFDKANNALPLTGGTLTGSLNVNASFYSETTTNKTLDVTIEANNNLYLDLSSSNFFKIPLDKNITTVNVLNIPNDVVTFYILSCNIQGNYVISWPATFKWKNGTAPTISNTVNDIHTFIFYTTDGGASTQGFDAGYNRL